MRRLQAGQGALEGMGVGDRLGEGGGKQGLGCRAWKREEGRPDHLPGFWEVCMRLWGKEALHPDLPLPPGNDLLWAFGLPAASAPGRRFQKVPQPSHPYPSPCPAGPNGSAIPAAPRKATGKGQG